jgi:hypothetical protein
MRSKTMTAIGLSAVLAVGVVAAAEASDRSRSRAGADSTGADSTGSDSTDSGATAHEPSIRSADFQRPRRNPYFPLKPGTVFRLRGTDEGEHFRERVYVTHRTKRILGIRTTVVKDVVRRADGTLAEKTRDWYAADARGNIWYLGEATASYDEDGNLESREGSWQAGKKGAVAGIIMPAKPRPTDAFRQEFYKGHAEDQAWLVQRGFETKVPFGTVKRSLRSLEWTRLEPRVVSMKIYGPGLGIVKEKDLSGGSEVFRLVSVHHRR